MLWIQVRPLAVTVVSGLLLLAFALSWYFSSPRSPLPAAAPSGAGAAPDTVRAPVAGSGTTAKSGPSAGQPGAGPESGTHSGTHSAGAQAAPSAAGPAALIGPITVGVPHKPAVPDESAAPDAQADPAADAAGATRVPAHRRRAVPAPPPSPGPVRMQRSSSPHGRRAAAAPVVLEMPPEPSRWTRTFGPPETGQIPLQPYLAGVADSLSTADAELPDRRQRSHSSL